MFLQMEMRRERERQEARKQDAARTARAAFEGGRRFAETPTLPPTTPLSPHPDGPRLDRGVYLYPFLSRRGNPIWIAVDSQHRHRQALEVDEQRSEALVRRILAGLLDQVDPMADLRLI